MRKTYVFTLLLFLWAGATQAQILPNADEKINIVYIGNDKPEEKVIKTQQNLKIGFGENLDGVLQGVEENTEWSISGKNFNKKGKGSGLLQEIFSTPGIYKIAAYTHHEKHAGGCEHPDIDAAITVEVKPLRIEWHWDETLWYNTLSSNKNFTNTKITIPVTVYTHSGKQQVAHLHINVAGIDCTLTGESSTEKPISFSNGETKNIDFVLNGTAGSNVYVMVDFTDENGHTVSYPVTKPIN